MNQFVHLRLGHFLMNEVGAEGAQGGGTTESADAGTQQSSQGDVGQQQSQAQQAGHESLLTDTQQQAQDQQQTDANKGVDQQQGQIPEKYEFANLPDGYTLDEAAAAEWSATFKDLGMSQDQVDKLVAADAKRSSAQSEAMQQQIADAHRQQVGEWIAQVKADPEIGGAKFAENVEIARSALKAYGSPELSQLLKETGLGSHPALLKAFHKAGLELGEGKLHRTTTDVPKPEMTIVDAFR